MTVWSPLFSGPPPDNWRRKPGVYARVETTRPIATGITSLWLMSETGGTQTFDAATSNVASNGTGAFTGPFTRVPGPFGRLCTGWNNAGSNPVNVAAAAGFANPHITVLCWVNLSQTQTSRVFASAFRTITNNGWALGIDDSTSNVVKWYTSDSSGNNNTLNSTTVLTNGQWYQVVSTYDGATKNVYVNGKLENSVGWTFGIDYSLCTNCLGGLPNGLQGLIGLLDHVFVWNRALFPGEVATLYRQPFIVVRPTVSFQGLADTLTLPLGFTCLMDDGLGFEFIDSW